MAKSILGAFMNEDLGKYNFNNQIENIHYTKIRPAKNNRELRNIEELAEDIAEDGLESNLVVRKIEDNTFEYELIAGERRFTAIKTNIEKGDMTYEYIPCKIVEVDDITARKRLILNNIQADPFSDAEKLEKIAELKEIYKELKASGQKIPGRIQKLIADDLGMSKSQVGNYEKILNNAIPEVREKIKDGDMTISAAAELSSMDDEEQQQFIESNDNFDLKAVRQYKEELEEDEAVEDLYAAYDDYDEYEAIEDEEADIVGASPVVESLLAIKRHIGYLETELTGTEIEILRDIDERLQGLLELYDLNL